MDAKELDIRMQWPLEQKIDHALHTIESFIATLGRDKVYVAFSGGKDSTVLLDLVRMIDKDIPAVFVNTGNEFPDIVYFVRHLRDDLGYNIEIIRPKSTPKQVWAKYGFPLVSKAQAEYIHRFRVNPDYAKRMIEKSEGKNWSFGIVSKRWQFLINTPFETSNECCNQLKKKPSHRYERKTGRVPILGTMTSESDARRLEYLRRGGCNTYDRHLVGSGVRSTPLAIWTDDDIWSYIRMRNLEIAQIYYKGARRTGCVGCGFGCWVKEDNRFDLLHSVNPKYYEMVMNYENNGVKYRDAVRAVFDKVHKTLPDETGELFKK